MRKVDFCPPWLRLCLAVAAIAGVLPWLWRLYVHWWYLVVRIRRKLGGYRPARSGVEFTSQNGFSDYFSGEIVSYGEYEAQGDILALHYLSPCGDETQLSCDIRLHFKVTGSTLVITDAYGDLVFTKVDSLY